MTADSVNDIASRDEETRLSIAAACRSYCKHKHTGIDVHTLFEIVEAPRGNGQGTPWTASPYSARAKHRNMASSQTTCAWLWSERDAMPVSIVEAHFNCNKVCRGSMLADRSPLSSCEDEAWRLAPTSVGLDLVVASWCLFGLGLIMPVSLAMSLARPVVHLEIVSVIASFHPLGDPPQEEDRDSDCLTLLIDPRRGAVAEKSK